ncbi:uncharacterized protein [Panulirus ornatus]|uniref:uncharacterized protein n=1 Tax=Panulirus ornatus TaxID=150431 RepID=UPI003A8B51E3
MKALVGVLVLSLVCGSAVADTQEGKDESAKFFVRSYSTTTWTFLSSLTSTIPYTCYTTGAANPPACMGRRRRRAKKLKLNLDDAFEMDEISSSSDGQVLAGEEEDGYSNKEKFFFTLWRTSSTTFTITTFSTNRSVTVSVSVFCTYPGIALQLCG